MLIGLMFSCRTHRHLHNNGQDSVNIAKTDSVANPKAPRTVKLDTIQNIIFHTYSANFSCEVNGMNVNGQIRIVHDSAIWISFSKIIELGRAVITPTRVKGYAKIVNKYFDGDYATLSKQWGIDVDYATLEAILVGNCVPHCVKSKEPKRENDSVFLWYNQKSANVEKPRQVTLLKSYKSKKLISAELYSPSVNQRLRCNYSNFANINSRIIPKTIGIVLHCKQINTSTQLNFEKTAINQSFTMPFSIPKRFKPL